MLNRQGNCMRLLVTNQLNTTSGSYRAIKSSIVQWYYRKFMWITTYRTRLSHIWNEIPLGINLYIWQGMWYRCRRSWWRYIKISIWRQIFYLLTAPFSFSTLAGIYALNLSNISPTENWRPHSRPWKTHTANTRSVGSTSQLYMQMDNLPHYKILSTSTCQEDPGSILQVQMNT